jgi:protein-tyrosine phosphatase
MQTDVRRRILLEGAVNFRDLGGYPARPGRQTRWNRVYRADNLAGLTEADLTLLETLGLTTLIDFRLPMEREMHPDRLPPGSSIRCVELGFLPEGTLEMLSLVKRGTIDVAELERRVIGQYRLFCLDHIEEFRQTFAIASEPDNHPLLLHCTSGKDRTGVAVALLLLAIGVPRETVLEDYSLTNLYRRPVPQLLGPETPEEVVQVLLSAQPKCLEAALEEIDRAHGSLDAYLEQALAVNEAQRERLIETLTEPLIPSPALGPGIAEIRSP